MLSFYSMQKKKKKLPDKLFILFYQILEQLSKEDTGISIFTEEKNEFQNLSTYSSLYIP